MNLQVARMATLAETVALCRKLLRGEAVSCGEGTMAQLPRIAPPVPIYVAATGRKMLELAGRIADGVILMNGVAPELICEVVRIARRARGQPSVNGKRQDRGMGRMPSKPRCREAQCSARHPAQYSGARSDLTRKVAAQVKQVYTIGSMATRKPTRAPHS
jgi:alkanesulfonate monooxygenase SsuD/methylene tetrahydromethanopterin reductase-like flavin-dependent oxidoreductase (luciferase family)